MVLSYYGIEKSEKDIARLTGSARNGVKGEKLLSVAKSFGLDGFIKENCTIEKLKKYVIDKKIPVIVAWFKEDEGHYSLVVHIDKENIYLIDPEIGHMRAIRISKFKKVWFDYSGDYIRSKNNFSLRSMLVIHE